MIKRVSFYYNISNSVKIFPDQADLFLLSAYSTRLQALIKKKLDVFKAFDEKVASFRAQLVAEEQFSQKVKPRPGRFN